MSADDPEVFLKRPDKVALMEQTKGFDTKKWCWVADDTEGFKAAEIKETKGDIVEVETADGKKVSIKKDDVQQMNPPKFEKTEDMANMTYLNEASVLHNLRARYTTGLIYTYSGLFCVCVNPYRRLPIYTEKVVSMYRGKRRAEMPPHIFAVCDNAYHDMLQDRENQSMLITGESGAGKTENTKKVIQFFANISGGGDSKKDAKDKKFNLEDQIIQANPILESYGNAKTIRNNNSSRFGKFVRCHFGPQGRLAGADIETYLLEKSRVIFQQPVERNYHIFYQILQGGDDTLLQSLLLDSREAEEYEFLKKGTDKVDGIDDIEEWEATEKAGEVLGFSDEDRLTMYKICAICLHWGNCKFKQRPREEQAEMAEPGSIEKTSFLLGVPNTDFLKSLIKPRIKVGTEYVNQGRSVEQVLYSIGALSKCIYERMFNWLVVNVNKTLDTKDRRAFFIGVLDIAGFEIFEVNSFEQLCINLTNEKLQQFFNHHMFVLEQEEYKKEGIEWTFIDFGMDLEACVGLIEKPMGVFPILEEECIVPKATDQTFLNKLIQQHDGKHSNFSKPKFSSKGKGGHFQIHHYAGIVPYDSTQWLTKNKDPINDCCAGVIAKSNNPLIAGFFADYHPDAQTGRKKGGSFQTVSARHREQLAKLMDMLYATSPHFIRCIIPNEFKKPGVVDAQLVLHQLRCNGVLEGIRICRKGFPNRIPFSEFKQRYQILAPNSIPAGFVDGKKACEKLLAAVELDTNEYRIGTTKVFFRAGVLGLLEDMRDDRLSKIISQFQAYCKGFLMRKQYKKMCEQRIGIAVIQRNVRKYLFLRNWSWWRLYIKVKPLLQIARADEEMKAKEEQLKAMTEKAEKTEAERKRLEDQLTTIMEERNTLNATLMKEQDSSCDLEDKLLATMKNKDELEAQLSELLERLEDEEASASELIADKRKLGDEIEDLKKDIDDLEITLKKAEDDSKNKGKQIDQLNEEMAKMEQNIAKLNKDKKSVEEAKAELETRLQETEDKVNHFSKLSKKLDEQLSEQTVQFEREKKIRADVEKAKRKLEGDVKMANESIDELNHQKADLENTVKKRDAELQDLNTKLEDKDALVASLQKKIRDLEARISELEEELESERSARAKAEKARAELARELEDLQERLEEQGGATQAQIEANRKREAEMAKLRKEMDEMALQNEQTVSSLRSKNQATINELSDELEAFKKSKHKFEKEKNALQADNDDLLLTVEQLQKAKANSDRSTRQTEEQLSEARAHNDDMKKAIGDLESAKSKFLQENTSLSQDLEDAESKNGQLVKAKKSLEAQIEELKRAFDEESKARSDAYNKSKTYEAELEAIQDTLEEEQDAKMDLQKNLARALSEAQSWKNKYEQEGLIKIEELTETVRKVTMKLTEAEEFANTTSQKYASAEKARSRLANENEDLKLEVDRLTSIATTFDKKQKALDRTISEWKSKLDELQAELDASHKDARAHQAEAYRLKSENTAYSETIEMQKREITNLKIEMKDLTAELGEGGKSVVEIEKLKKKLEMEKEELQAALDEAENSLELEEGKVLRMQLELTQIKGEAERRYQEREEEFEASRKNHQRQLESVQASIEAEIRSKTEQARLRKKAEKDLSDAEVGLENEKRAHQETLKNLKKLQQALKDAQQALEEETRSRDEMREAASRAERRLADKESELEEIRTSYETSERSRRILENERNESNDRVTELSALLATSNTQRKKFENEVMSLQGEREDLENERRDLDEKFKRVNAENARLSADIDKFTERVTMLEKTNSLNQKTIQDLMVRLEEAEAAGAGKLKKEVRKLEVRLKDSDRERERLEQLCNEMNKNARRNDRRVKELMQQIEETQKSHDRMVEEKEKIATKLKKTRSQMEEYEMQAQQNLSRYRNAQRGLEELEERADTAEAALQRHRARAGASGSALSSSSTREEAIPGGSRTIRETTYSYSVSSSRGKTATEEE